MSNSQQEISVSELFDIILQIDFNQQVQLFRKVICVHSIAAFLVYGEPYCGQQILVNRLIRLIPNWRNTSPIKINVSFHGSGRNTPHLWRMLSSWFCLPKDSEPERIIDKICERNQTKDMIFIFDYVDYMPPKVLARWLQEFWNPLIGKIGNNLPLTQKDAYLLMFLVDNSGSVRESNIPLAKEVDDPEYPKIPLCLPPVSPFPQEVLDDWINMVTTMKTMQIPTGLTSKILLEKSDNGIPEFVYEEICNYWGYSWEGVLAKWLI